MTKSAELRAQDFEMPRLRGCEMEREIQPWHKILLNPEFANIKGVSNVFCMHQEMNFSIDWDGHLRRDNVIASFHVICRIEPEVVLISFVNFVGMKRTKLSVRSRIPKIKSKLPRLGLNLQRVRFRRRKIHFGPSFLSKYAQSEHFRSHENECGYNH